MRLGAPRSRRDERAGLARSAHRNRRIRKLGSSGESVGDCLRKNTWGAGTSGPSFPPPRPPTLLPSSCSAAEFARFLRMNERRRSPGQRRPPGGHRRTRAPGACGTGAGSLQSQESLFLLGNTVSTVVSGPNVTHRFVGRGQKRYSRDSASAWCALCYGCYKKAGELGFEGSTYSRFGLSIWRHDTCAIFFFLLPNIAKGSSYFP